ncbi:MAG TPA: translocation/assembly module TamB [Acidobacteriaceae bacterium]|nr:translocation/assembly module TamB [Acidobacteriaceae bacterium]
MSATPTPEITPRRRYRAGHILLVSALWIAGLLAILLVALAVFADSPLFQNRVRHALIAELEKSTGGRAELGRFAWNLWHLEFEADNLTIHGLEAPDQIPYLQIERLYIRLRIASFFRPKIALNYLEADRPVIHLIIYPDGSTNQPQPPRPSPKGSTRNEIFNLAIARTVVSDGVAIVNQRAMPFSLAANDLAAQVSYDGARDHYTGTLHARDIVARRAADIPVHSTLDASLDAGRNTVSLVSLTLRSGLQGAKQQTVLRATGSLTDFRNPHWQFTVKGAVDVLALRALTGIPGLAGGTAQIDAAGSGAMAQFSVDGTAGLTGGAYRTGTVSITGAEGTAALHASQDVIAVNNIHARAAGGTVDGDLRILHWQAPAPPPGRRIPPGTPVTQGIIRTRIAGFALDRVLDLVAPPRYRRFGFDTVATGTASVDWTGDVSTLVGAVNVTLAPPQTPTPGEVPVTGSVQAQYIQRSGAVAVASLDVHTPASSIQVSGSLGVYPDTRPTQLTARLVTGNLAEFNPALEAFGIAAHGQPSPIPASLHGQAQFHGEVSGSLASPDFRGHVQASNFDITPRFATTAAPGLQAIHFDSMTADAEYSAGSLSIGAATLVQKKTTIHLNGEVRGNPRSPADLFAETSAIRARVEVQNADLSSWMALTGRSYPVSGTLNLHAQTGGTIGNLSGGGALSLTGGAIGGESFRSLTADIAFRGKEVSAFNLVFVLDGGRITGSGGYDFGARTVQFDVQGSGFELASIRRIRNDQYPLAGAVDFAARGSGPIDSPSLQTDLHVRNLSLARVSTGFVDVEAHTVGRTLQTHVSAQLNTATLDLSGETQLSGDYPTRASLDVSKFDIDPILRTFSVTGIRGSSSIVAAATITGPLRHPRQLSGDVRVSNLSLTLEDVPIHSDGTLHAVLAGGTLRVDPIHILGPDTDVHMQGSVGVFTPGSTPHPIEGHAGGSINMALAQMLDTDILSSGHVDFTVTAQGTTQKPDLVGNVRFANVNVALEDYINGLSRMNGELVFDQDRLDFKNVTAYSGGGLIRVGGFVTYHRGLYADLTATARGVRIRYPQGVSSTADADLRFQGTQASMLLSGTVTLTAFSISPDVDFASVAASSESVTLPPNPDSPSNRVRLDIRVTSAPSLDFQNSFARLAGNVDLNIRNTLAQPTVLGRVTITEGSATFNGEKFQLQHGEIYFSNPVRIQPNIDVTATTTVEDYNITITVQGNASRITPTFRSDPPLSEQDIFSLLAMGRTQEEQQIYSTEQQQAGVNSTADSLLGGALNATLSSRIQKLFGGGSVRIDPTFVSGVGNATARITVQEPLSRQATLTYATNVNSTAEQLIQAEWRMTPDFSVLAVRDESGVFSLIFRLHRRYH